MFLKISDKKKRYLLLAGSFLALVLILVAVVMAVGYMLHRSYGWFSSNIVVNNTGMSVKTSTELFEIVLVDNPNQKTGIGFDANGTDVLNFLNLEENGGFEKLDATNAAHTKIYCLFKNEKPDNTLGAEVIKPGDFGTVSFDIVKKVEGDLKLLIDLSSYGIRSVATETYPNNFVLLDPEETDPDTGNMTDDAEAARYLDGHIVFFSDRDEIVIQENGEDVATGEYYYSDLLTDNKIIFDTANPDATPEVTEVTVDGVTHYRVTIYWIWPSTFAQIAYDEGDVKLHTHAMFGGVGGAAQRNVFLQHISDSYVDRATSDVNLFFKNCKVKYLFNAGMEQTYYVELSDGYNNADQMIGDNIAYIAVEAAVSLYEEPPAEETPEPEP